MENARQDWEDGYRRLQAEARDRARYEQVLAQVEAVTQELRRRLGETFTVAELAAVYATAESWSRDAVAERAPSPSWARTVSLAADAAFYLYARRASDYTP